MKSMFCEQQLITMLAVDGIPTMTNDILHAHVASYPGSYREPRTHCMRMR